MDPTFAAIGATFIGFVLGSGFGFARFEVKESEMRKRLQLYELTDLMADRMLEEEDKDAREARAKRIRTQVRDIVHKEFE